MTTGVYSLKDDHINLKIIILTYNCINFIPLLGSIRWSCQVITRKITGLFHLICTWFSFNFIYFVVLCWYYMLCFRKWSNNDEGKGKPWKTTKMTRKMLNTELMTVATHVWQASALPYKKTVIQMSSNKENKSRYNGRGITSPVGVRYRPCSCNPIGKVMIGMSSTLLTHVLMLSSRFFAPIVIVGFSHFQVSFHSAYTISLVFLQNSAIKDP